MKVFITLILIFVIMVALVIEPAETASIEFFIKVMLLKIIIFVNLVIIYLINKKKGGHYGN